MNLFSNRNPTPEEIAEMEAEMEAEIETPTFDPASLLGSLGTKQLLLSENHDLFVLDIETGVAMKVTFTGLT